jgi:hypothetical protein
VIDASRELADLAHQRRRDILATYNAERARGIVHTPEWDAKMAKEQQLFDAEPVVTKAVL